MQSDRQLVDITVAERLTGLAKATLYRLARTGRLRSFRVLGRALRFEQDDLLALAEERRFPHRSQATTYEEGRP